MLTFEWDPKKEKENIKKHQVSFEEASTVFGDPLAMTVHDPDHSETEDRFATVGESYQGKIIVVIQSSNEISN